MSIFNSIKQRWRSHKDMKALHGYADVFSTLATLQRKGLIRWVEKDRRLFISEPVAVLMMSQGEQSWSAFLQNVFLWQFYKLQQQTWDSYIFNEERKAVLERKAKGVKVSNGELERIRRRVRDGIQVDAVAIPPLKKFEFFVLGENADETTDAEASILLVGNYNPETEIFEQADWQSVSMRIKELNKAK